MSKFTPVYTKAKDVLTGQKFADGTGVDDGPVIAEGAPPDEEPARRVG